MVENFSNEANILKNNILETLQDVTIKLVDLKQELTNIEKTTVAPQPQKDQGTKSPTHFKESEYKMKLSLMRR